jgi:thymidylate kinase
MNRKIVRVVLTGGPCAGKSTAKQYVTDHFTNQGYRVVFVDESPTQLMQMGAGFTDQTDFFEFERAAMYLQVAKEDVMLDRARSMLHSKILLVVDRGILDIAAYLRPDQFNMLCGETHLCRHQILRRYDHVFHLVTAADGAPQHFSSDSNRTRYETSDQAIDADRRTYAAWAKHPSHHRIDNSTDFNGKMQRLISAISGAIV